MQCKHKDWNKIHNSVTYVIFLRKSLAQVDFILKNASCDGFLGNDQ
jgi:hypothetical protein